MGGGLGKEKKPCSGRKLRQESKKQAITAVAENKELRLKFSAKLDSMTLALLEIKERAKV